MTKPIDLEIVEETLRKTLSPDKFGELASLKERRTPGEIEQVLKLIFPSEIASKGGKELAGAGWPDVLLFVHIHSLEKARIGEKVGQLIIKEREGFSTAFGCNVEAQLEAGMPVALPLFTARKYVREIRKLLPKVIRRAGLLRLVPTGKDVPEYVRRYLIEASRCYIYGHFLASLFLCRSAIEEAVEDALRSRGHEKQMSAITKDRLKGIVELAYKENLMDQTVYRQADDIRILANDAIHGSRLPADEECKNAFDQTRGILQYLYG